MENCEESTSGGKPFSIPGYKDANSYCGAAFRSILAATRASNELPSESDFDYYSTFKGFQKVMQSKGQSILSLMTSLIQGQSIEEQFQGRTLEDKFDLLENVNETILENISTCIDEACGLKKKDDPELVKTVVTYGKNNIITTSWNKKQFGSNSPGLVAAKDISRPQLFFKDTIDNSNAPFIPLIKEKPNSIKPLAITLEKDFNKEEYCHPYEWEIEKYTVPDALLEEVQPVKARPLEETPLVFVKTEEQLKKLCAELLQQKEFAVDLEHHSYRSFQGFTCLMQISTREADYIIDTIELRSELHLLNQAFTDPKIVKVFHGADMDIVWLQKDFGVYVVNLFDTGQAARVLSFRHLSLSYLLIHYCGKVVDKQYQLADWRIRPLPHDMINYARQDTHDLLYIYDCMKNDLIKKGNETKNLIRSAFERSRMISLKKYEKLIFTEGKYLELYKKSKKTLNIKQLYCLKELFSWRDKVARETDESLAYVLPNHMMLEIAESLPREQQGVLACCNPIPPLVKQQMNEIHSIVLSAINSSTAQLAALELQQKAQGFKKKYQNNLTDLTRCPHDLLQVNEKKIQSSNSSNLSTTLPFITKDCPVTISSKPTSFTVLFDNYSKKNQSASLNKVSEKLSKLYSPFQRYKMTERLQINSETKFNAEQKSSNTKEMSEIAKRTHQSLQETSEDNIDDNDISGDQNTTSDLSAPSTSKANFSSTPLRKKSKKKKRKAQPDLSLNCTPINQGPPPKKSKTPETEEANNKFVPYDYSKADLSSFSGKKKSKNVFKPGTEHNFKAPGKHHGRSKKHFKQGTFGNKNIPEKKKWPQNK